MKLFAIFLILILTLVNMQPYLGKCTSGNTNINFEQKDKSPIPDFPQYLKNLEGIEMPEAKHFESILKTVIYYQKKSLKIILKFVLLKNFNDKMLISNEKIDSRTYEHNFLNCHYDETYVYIIKFYFTKKNICKKLHELGTDIPKDIESVNFKLSKRTGLLKGSLNLLSTIFDLDKQIAGEGGYGKVKKFNLDNDKKIAIKKVPVKHMDLREVAAMIKFQNSIYGIRFYGCFYDNENFYIAQQNMKMALGSPEFSDYYLQKPKIERLEFIIGLCNALIDLKGVGMTHNDIKPDNIMIDNDGKPHLIDFGFAVPIGANNPSGKTKLFCSPDRYFSKEAKSIFDLYSLALLIVSIESKLNANVLNYKFGKKEFIPNKCYKGFRDEECKELLFAIILGTLTNNWGEINTDVTNISEMNLTTLITVLVFEFDESIDINDFTNQLQVILQAFKEKDDSVISKLESETHKNIFI